MRTFKIDSNHDVYEDSYEHGEGGYVNNWNESAIVVSNTLEEAVDYYFSTTLYYNYDSKFNAVEDDKLYYSVLVDNDNCEITSDDAIYEEWKDGKATLYNQHISITVSEVVSLNIEDEL